MAIGQRTFSTDPKGTASNTHLITKPTGTVSGDVLYVLICTNGSTISGGTTGWTQIYAGVTQTNPKLYLYRRVCDGSEGASWTFNLTSSVTSGSICVCLTGVDNTTPEDTAIQVGTNSTGSGTMTVPAITIVTAGAWLLYGCGINSASSAITKDASMVEIAEAGTRKHELDSELRASTGTTGTRAASAASNTLAWAAMMVAVRPAGGAAFVQTGVAVVAM